MKISLSKAGAPTNTLLLAAAVDRLSLLVYANTKDAQKKRNQPKSIIAEMIKQEKPKDHLTFSSGAEFEAARAKLIKDLEKEV